MIVGIDLVSKRGKRMDVDEEFVTIVANGIWVHFVPLKKFRVETARHSPANNGTDISPDHASMTSHVLHQD